MSTVEQMQREIAKLPPEDFRKLADWVEKKRAVEWDQQLELAATDGTLDHLWENAKIEIAAGKARPLDGLLDH